jgi:hypothetical protein
MRSAVLVTDRVPEASAIEVRDSGGFKGVFAKAAIVEGSIIFRLKGTISTEPSKYTIQVGSQQHLSFQPTQPPTADLDSCWQYLNHSCEPSCYMKAGELTFRALRNIAAGEEITFNYLTTESKMAVPFHCICGSPNCFGFIQGRNFLTAAQAARLALQVGEDNLVTLFMPAVQKLSGELEASQPGLRR